MFMNLFLVAVLIGVGTNLCAQQTGIREELLGANDLGVLNDIAMLTVHSDRRIVACEEQENLRSFYTDGLAAVRSGKKVAFDTMLGDYECTILYRGDTVILYGVVTDIVVSSFDLAEDTYELMKVEVAPNPSNSTIGVTNSNGDTVQISAEAGEMWVVGLLLKKYTVILE